MINKIFSCYLLCILFTPLNSYAFGLTKMSFEDRISNSTHIFIGEVTNIVSKTEYKWVLQYAEIDLVTLIKGSKITQPIKLILKRGISEQNLLCCRNEKGIKYLILATEIDSFMYAVHPRDSVFELNSEQVKNWAFGKNNQLKVVVNQILATAKNLSAK